MASHGAPNRLAQLAVQSLEGRQDYRGGWPLGYTGPDCPAYATERCTRSYGFSNQNCCPTGQFCVNNVLSIYCCPTESDCQAAVENRPVCSNSTWDLYRISGDYFCCPNQYFGVLPISGSSGLCESNIDGLPASRLATKVVAPTSPPGGSSPSIPTSAPNSGGGSGGGSNGGGSSGSSSTPGSGSQSGDRSGGSSISAGAIAGIVIGGILLLLGGAAVLLWFHRKSMRKDVTSAKVQEATAPPAPDSGLIPVSEYHQAQYQQPQHYPVQNQPVQYHSTGTDATTMSPTPAPPEYSSAPMHPEVDGTHRVEMPTSRS